MKTKTITLVIPEDQRLGQAIMNSHRDEWLTLNYCPECEKTDETGLKTSAIDIWEEDTEQIQEKLNKLK